MGDFRMTDFVAPLLLCEDSLEDIAKVNTRGNGSLPQNFLKGIFEIKTISKDGVY